MTEPTPAERLAATFDLLRAEQLGFDIHDPEVVRTVVENHKKKSEGREEHDKARIAATKEAHANGTPIEPESVVYYMRVGNRVKIGYTTNLERRIATVMPEETLASEPGGRMLEGVRHKQFAALHVNREWFRLEGALLTHVKKLQARS